MWKSIGACIVMIFAAQSLYASVINVPQDYPTISAAILAAQPNDTVVVAAGTYDEILYITKPVTILGQDRDSTILYNSRSEYHNSLMDIHASVHIQNLTVRRELMPGYAYQFATIKVTNTDSCYFYNIHCQEGPIVARSGADFGVDNIRVVNSHDVHFTKIQLEAGDGGSVLYTTMGGGYNGTNGGNCVTVSHSINITIDSSTLNPGHGGLGGGQYGSNGNMGLAIAASDSSAIVLSHSTFGSAMSQDGTSSITLIDVKTGVARTESLSPQSYLLFQNFPNPFNPSTTLSFVLPTESFVSLKIFDALGREVSIVDSEELPAGKYERQWSAIGFSSGIYFLHFQAGLFTETKKIILLK